MGINLSRSNLFSRTNALGNPIRRIASNPFALLNGVGGISIVNHLKGFAVASALQAIPSLIWSFSQLWALFTESALVLYTFDWNMPDEQIDAQMQNQWNAYGSVLGGTVGNALGYLACGMLPATSLLAVDEKMALYVLERVGEEAIEEFIFNVAATVRYGARALVQRGIAESYKNVRRWLKRDDNGLLNTIVGDAKASEIRAAWGEQEGKPFTIAGAIEERIEQIPSQFWRNFTEEVIDEAIEGCIEAGYVVTTSMDAYYAEKRLGERREVKTIEIQPDRENDRERIVVSGEADNIKSTITSTLAAHQLIEGRDVGQIIGTPVDDYVRDKPLSLRLKFRLYNVPTPPYRRTGGNRLVEVNITVPDVRRAALDWATLKQALGGPNGYLWGRYKAKGRVGPNQYVTCYGASPDEAEDRLRAIMFLSDLTVETINVTEERRSDERLVNPRLQKEVTRVYPGYVTIINRQRVIAVDQGRAAIDGNYLDRQERFALWRDTPPIDFDQRLQEVLRYSTP